MSYVKDFMENWRDHDGSFAHKVRMAAKNRARALARGCCGNHGEPGC